MKCTDCDCWKKFVEDEYEEQQRGAGRTSATSKQTLSASESRSFVVFYAVILFFRPIISRVLGVFGILVVQV